MPTPEPCKSCRHRYNDVSEGQNCRKLDRKIILSNGVISWPGWDVEQAIGECKGLQASPSLMARIRYHIGM